MAIDNRPTRIKTLIKYLYSFCPYPLTVHIGKGKREHLRIVDFSVLETLRKAPLNQLTNSTTFEALLPTLGLCGGKMYYPAHLNKYRDKGLLHMQMPNQFAPYLIKLSELGVRKYCEIGVKYGGTFAITTEYLQRLSGLEYACAADINYCPSLVRYSRRNRRASFYQLDSASDSFLHLLKQHKFDAVFVDGDHEEKACYNDILNATQYARHVIVHDISNDYTPGPGNAWKQMKKAFSDRYIFHEFTAQYADLLRDTGNIKLLGIGLAELIDRP